jgi:hypothetical protein
MQRGHFVNKTQLSRRAVILLPAVNQVFHVSTSSIKWKQMVSEYCRIFKLYVEVPRNNDEFCS